MQGKIQRINACTIPEAIEQTAEAHNITMVDMIEDLAYSLDASTSLTYHRIVNNAANW